MKKLVCGISHLMCMYLLAGCIIQPVRPVGAAQRPMPPPPVAEVIVAREPPAPIVEVIPLAPSPNHVWIAGFWSWREGKHVWVAGHYVMRLHPHAVWVTGRWERRPLGWVWIEGFWR